MEVLHISFEFYPLAKTGGLADVVGALPKYLNNLDISTGVILPKYDKSTFQDLKVISQTEGTVLLGTTEYLYTIEEIKDTRFEFPLYIVAIPSLLNRDQMYGYPDDVERFLGFQIAVLQWILTLKDKPQILHCHDHHTGLIPFMKDYCYDFEDLKPLKSIITIHNAQYQGQFGYEYEHYLPYFNEEDKGLLDWDQLINPLATAIKCADRVTTVSPTYMRELQQSAAGLEGLLVHEKNKCIGILNGIDATYWNPKTDSLLKEPYDRRNFISKRKIHKEWLCDTYGFIKELPLFIFIGRLVYEKGVDLLPEVIEKIMPQANLNLLLLGSGDQVIAANLKAAAQKVGTHCQVHIGYDEQLSHLMYAGGDFILMPSRVEPCGLNQMYALRYGTIPVVRRTGGLQDTVVDIGDDGYGICHAQATVTDICEGIRRAVELYSNSKFYRQTQRKAMQIDNSWNHSAKQYKTLYQSLIKYIHD
ncbi:glycogen/starch synthase [Aquimarina sp. ERC-38]|uniref:glycogen synthase n=1 Tax=Aquimarina sp. ERC-38 TaxID=2949996 RepID=UPI002246E945|nr:glycogen/starch synthase [Aquimarina sp. ERC-38]UZO80112.1 glycogen/starch synthase [Aquimarina sp. ERC-38]